MHVGLLHSHSSEAFPPLNSREPGAVPCKETDRSHLQQSNIVLNPAKLKFVFAHVFQEGFYQAAPYCISEEPLPAIPAGQTSPNNHFTHDFNCSNCMTTCSLQLQVISFLLRQKKIFTEVSLCYYTWTTESQQLPGLQGWCVPPTSDFLMPQ